MKAARVRTSLSLVVLVALTFTPGEFRSDQAEASSVVEIPVVVSGANSWAHIPMVPDRFAFRRNLLTAAMHEIATQEQSLRVFISKAKALGGERIQARYSRNGTWNSRAIDQGTLSYGYQNRLERYAALDASGTVISESPNFPRVPRVTALMLVRIAPDFCTIRPKLENSCTIRKVSPVTLLRATLGSAISSGPDMLSLRLDGTIRALRTVLESGYPYTIRKNILIPRLTSSQSLTIPSRIYLSLGWPSYGYKIRIRSHPRQILVTKFGPKLQQLAARGHWDTDLKAVFFN